MSNDRGGGGEEAIIEICGNFDKDCAVKGRRPKTWRQKGGDEQASEQSHRHY